MKKNRPIKNNHHLKKWARECTEGILESEIFLQLYNPRMSDARQSLHEPEIPLQLGYAMMLNKPIVVLADHNDDLPSRLQSIAEVIRYDREDADSLDHAVKRIGQIAEKQKKATS